MSSLDEAKAVLDRVLSSVSFGRIVESETVELKTATNGFSTEEFGKYFSALSNEANIQRCTSAWMIFGVTDEGIIVGTQYLANPHARNEFKREIADRTPERFGITDIFEISKNGKRIVMVKIPPAPRGTPISYRGHYYGRDGESLVPLSPQKRRVIECQSEPDWSAEILPDATIDDLDEKAVAHARELYRQKYPNLAAEIDTWDTVTFLNKAKVTIRGKITRGAILLLGKPESEVLLSPSQAKIKWILQKETGELQDYVIVTCPFLLGVEEIYKKIINLTYRYMLHDSIFPRETQTYDPYILRESLNNAISHQNYTLNSTITIVQTGNTLLITNPGDFLPVSVEKVIESDSPETYSRNSLLSTAMFNFQMGDTIGSGIKRMFIIQKNKGFPLPDYEFGRNKVSVRLTGEILNPAFAEAMVTRNDITLGDAILLDKVQKKHEITSTEMQHLLDVKLVFRDKDGFVIQSGRRSADSGTHKPEYTGNYKDIILEYIRSSPRTRSEINTTIYPILPSSLSSEQKRTKVNHLLTTLSKEGKIVNTGTKVKPMWNLKP